ncbi:heterokaryon incompatibility protein-domain-containing protein [Lophiotrema nucula]|uniref:Heterokaryon incompatibility protein-domain-containing protein n=1 Tax=Lophiotrema nucula TaxID=690887 RepID=A0A6A5ZWT9_9PLEO|nr:heterokaryon incompatibility protein-domain-containing protein [Lophiotrema nucula]
MDYRDRFGLFKVNGDYWPARLLHVESWTSYRREDGNTYRGHSEPAYNIISYTWGRWEIKGQGSSLGIKGVEWTIPSVNAQDAFSVDQFRKVIEVACEGVDFLWIDIACIDQENRADKMKEISNQASIFFKAEKVFVWLHQWDHEKLEEQVGNMNEILSELESQCHMVMYSSGSDDEDMDWETAREEIPECLRDDEWINKAVKALKKWREEPWFTSLWTLQEMHLSESATILSKGATTVSLDGKIVGINHVEDWVDSLTDAVRGIYFEEPFPTGINKPKLDQILEHADILGLGQQYFQNTCTIYSAAKFRTASQELDYVYGIMQLFDLQLGEASEPDGKFSLQDLRMQFAAALNRRHPIFSQLFVHSKPPEHGLSWMVGENSILPLRLHWNDLMPEAYCEIQVNEKSGIAHFRGGGCSFQSLSALLRQINEERPSKRWQDILLDAWDDSLEQIPEDFLNLDRAQNLRFHELGDALSNIFGGRLKVFWLGIATDPARTSKELSIGILAMETSISDRTVFRRIGLYLWPELEDDSPHLDMFEKIWEQMNAEMC